MNPTLHHPAFAGLAGIARADITPPPGIYCRNWGAARHDVAQGVHRPLTLSCLTLQESAGTSPLVLLDADLGWWANLEFERAFRSRILAASQLPAHRLLFALSHTHSAPPLCAPEPSWPGAQLLADFLQNLEQASIQLIQSALQNTRPALLDFHHGHCALAANRDLPDPAPSPTNRWVCGYNPASKSPADPVLTLGRLATPSGHLLASITHYACHPTTLAWDNSLISPDYLGAFRQTMQDHLQNAPALFLQGASGELAPRHQYVGDPAIADSHGLQLAHAALATYHDMNPVASTLELNRIVESGAPLAAWSPSPRSSHSDRERSLVSACDKVSLPLKDWPSAAQLEHEYRTCADRALAERLRRKLRIRQSLGDGDRFDLELWGWRIGNALILGTMTEAYSVIQSTLRQTFPNQTILWLNLVNGSIGYLPPADFYDRDIYQVWQTPFDRGSLERLTEAAIRLATRLGATPA